jgi:alanyl aminopeptidase
MWFGDLVTMAWWDDLWLNESFASWMEDKITAEVHPELDSQVGEVKNAQRVMALDSLLTTRAMRQPVRSMDSLLQSADALAYSKGAAVLHMIERWIGPEAFRAGVLQYLKAHADGNATADDLWNALSAASGKDVAAALSSFLDRPGVPLVAVELLPEGRVKLTQSRFVNAGATPPPGQTWRIPVRLRYPVGALTKTQTVLLTRRRDDQARVEDDSRLDPPERRRVGLLPLVRALRDVLQNGLPSGGHLEHQGARRVPGERARCSSRALRGEDYVKMLQAFASDPDPEVVGNVLAGLGKIRGTFFAEGRDAEFAPFVRKTLAPALTRFGAAKHEGEPERVTALRPNLLETLGDAGRDEGVLTEMERLAAAYLTDPASIDPSLAEKAIQLSAIRGDAALFDRYRARFETATVPADRRHFLSALGNFRDPALADRARAYVLEGPLRPQEVLSIPRNQAKIPTEAGKIYGWMTAHYTELAARIPADFMVFMPYFAEGCSSDRVAAAKTFFAEPDHAPPGTSKELSRVSESVGDCVTLDAREGESVRRYATSVR